MASASAKPFAVFDFDGTFFRWQMFHAIVHRLGVSGLLSESDHQKIKSARMRWKNRQEDYGFHSYERVLVKTYFAALANMDSAAHEKAVTDVFDEYKDQVFTYTKNLAGRLKNEGYFLLAISGSHHAVVEKLADYHGFDDCIGATFAAKDGRLTGEYKTPVHDKAAALQSLIKKHGLSRKNSFGFGDTASDIPMLELVDNAIALNPEQKLLAHAESQGWKIVVERKNVVYTLHPKTGSYELA